MPSASIFSVPDGRARGSVSVQGTIDSLPALVDSLVAGLLATDVNATGRAMADLATTSLPALRAYLIGRAEYRRDHKWAAGTLFRHALEIDSTFALAALGVAASDDWRRTNEPERVRRALERAWKLRDRMTPRDRDIFVAYVGLPYPARRSGAEELADWDRAVARSPDPDPLYELGDRLFHVGPAMGIADWQQRAAAAFLQALALDSTLLLPRGHLIELAARSGDTAMVRRQLALFQERDSASSVGGYMRWRAAVALRDQGSLAALRQHMPTMSRSSLQRIVGMSQLEAVALADGRRAAQVLAEQATTKELLVWNNVALQQLALNEGRPRDAQLFLGRLAGIEPLALGIVPGVVSARQLAVFAALFAEGDSAAAGQAARELARADAAPFPPGAAALTYRVGDLCALELWRVAHGITSSTPQTIARLRATRPSGDSLSFLYGDPSVCIAALDALHKAATSHAGADAALARLDSLMMTWPAAIGTDVGNLIVARLAEARGDLPRALAAVRRRPNYWTNGPQYLATALRTEGRLAALTGDPQGARRAYAHYLTLRSNPEPALRAAVDSVRAELRRLEAVGGRL